MTDQQTADQIVETVARWVDAEVDAERLRRSSSRIAIPTTW